MNYTNYYFYNEFQKKKEQRESNEELFYKQQIKRLSPEIDNLINQANLSKKAGYLEDYFKRNDERTLKFIKDKEGKFNGLSLNNQLFVYKQGEIAYSNINYAKNLLPVFLNRFKNFSTTFNVELEKSKKAFDDEWEMGE